MRSRFTGCVLALGLALVGCWSPHAPSSVKAGARSWQVPTGWQLGYSLAAIHGRTLDDLYAVGDRGRALRSRDRGATWTVLPLPQAVYFRAVWSGPNGVFAAGVAFSGSEPGVIMRIDTTPPKAVTVEGVDFSGVWGTDTATYVIGTQAAQVEGQQPRGFVLRTLDGGATWSTVQLGTSELVAIGGDAAMVHVLAQDGSLFSSNDGTSYAVSKLPEGRYEALDITPARMLATSTDGLVRSTDRGATWATVAKDRGGRLWSSGDRVLVFRHRRLSRSDDGGVTWREAIDIAEAVQSVVGTPDGFVGVGGGGVILTSPDGEHWTRRDHNVAGRIRGIWGDGDRVLMVGDDRGRGGVIVRAAADGERFTLVHQGWPALNGVWGSADVVIAVGQSGTVTRSLDRGANWSTGGPAGTRDLTAVGGCDLSAIYAASESGQIWSSLDRGLSWTAVASQPLGALRSVVCWEGRVFVGGPVDVVRMDGAVATPMTAAVSVEEHRSSKNYDGGRLAVGLDGLWWLRPDGLWRHRGGAAWKLVRATIKEQGPWLVIWGTPMALWLGGWAGEALVRDRGGREVSQATPFSEQVTAVWGTPSGDLWAASSGIVARFALAGTKTVTP